MPRIIYTEACGCGFKDVVCGDCGHEQDYTTDHGAKSVEPPEIRSTDWLAGAPEVLPGHRWHYLVTVIGQNGRPYVRTAHYANEYWLDWHEDYLPDDDDDETEGKKWTGWQEDRLDRCGDEITMDLEGTVIGYMPLPAPANVAICREEEGSK